MLVAAFALIVALTPAHASAPPPARQAARHSAKGPRPAIAPGDLYSSRAKRRIASYLRMRLLELRLRSLERAASVVEHRLTVDDLLNGP